MLKKHNIVYKFYKKKIKYKIFEEMYYFLCFSIIYMIFKKMWLSIFK